MSIKVLAIINQASGKGDILDKVDEIKQNLEEQHMQVDMKFTEKENNTKNMETNEKIY